MTTSEYNTDAAVFVPGVPGARGLEYSRYNSRIEDNRSKSSLFQHARIAEWTWDELSEFYTLYWQEGVKKFSWLYGCDPTLLEYHIRYRKPGFRQLRESLVTWITSRHSWVKRFVGTPEPSNYIDIQERVWESGATRLLFVDSKQDIFLSQLAKLYEENPTLFSTVNICVFSSKANIGAGGMRLFTSAVESKSTSKHPILHAAADMHANLPFTVTYAVMSDDEELLSQIGDMERTCYIVKGLRTFRQWVEYGIRQHKSIFRLEKEAIPIETRVMVLEGKMQYMVGVISQYMRELVTIDLEEVGMRTIPFNTLVQVLPRNFSMSLLVNSTLFPPVSQKHE